MTAQPTHRGGGRRLAQQVYSGRAFTAQDLAAIGALMQREPTLNRAQLSRRVCLVAGLAQARWCRQGHELPGGDAAVGLDGVTEYLSKQRVLLGKLLSRCRHWDDQ